MKRAGLVFAHNGSSSYYAAILDRGAQTMALYKVTSGSWGSALTYVSATISTNTAYTLKVARKQSQVQVALVGQGSFIYDSTTDLGTGKSGLYASHSDIKFDNFKAYRGVARDAKTPRVGGLADTSLSSNKLLTDTDVLNHPGGESIVANISDTYFVAQAVVTNSTNADLWFRYSDANTSYKVGIKAETSVTVDRYENGKKTQLAYTTYSPHPTLPFTLRVAIYNNAGTDTIKVYTNSDAQRKAYRKNPHPFPFPGRERGLWDRLLTPPMRTCCQPARASAREGKVSHIRILGYD